MLMFLAMGLPLELLPQAAVQSLSLACIIALRSDCQSELLDSPLMERRLGSCLSLFALLLGTTPWPVEAFELLSERRKKCAHFLNFLLIFLGWVLPLYAVTRRTIAGTSAASTRSGPNSGTRSRRATSGASGAQQTSTASHQAALWLSRYAFMDGQPLRERLWAWYLLATLSWLVAQLAAALGCR